MTRDDIEFIVLNLLSETAASEAQRQAVLQRLDYLRFSEAMRSRHRRQFLLRALLYVAFGILILLAFQPLVPLLIRSQPKPIPVIAVPPLDDFRSEELTNRKHTS